VKRLLQQAGGTADDEAWRCLQVVDRFDRLVASQAGPLELVQETATLTGAAVGMQDTLSDLAVAADPRGGEVADAERVTREVAAAAVAQRLRGRHHRMLDTPLGPVAAASIEAASGRLGVVWSRLGTEWTAVQGLALERAAAALAIRALHEQDRRAHAARVEPAALERLLAADVASPEAAAVAARRAGLDPARQHLVVVLQERPAAAASPEALLALALRGAHARGVSARGTLVGRRPIIVCEDATALDDALRDAIATAQARGFALDAGIGEPAALEELGTSLSQAREALVLGGLTEHPDGATRFGELGLLHLLAQIPSKEVRASPEVRRVAALDGASGGISDLRLLEVYCETASLRQTAARLFVHHSSVDYRLKRIEEALGLSLGEPGDRMRALIAIKLLRIDRVREE